MLQIESVSKQYSTKVLLTEASAHLRPSSRVGLVGPNGAGKTTLFRMILGEESPDKGSIRKRPRLRIGYLPQELETITGKTVLDAAHRDEYPEYEAKRILMGLGFTEADFGRLVEKLSGGYRMRVALAHLLLSNPDVLMLDEPTNHLDKPTQRWFEQFLLGSGMTLLIISHDTAFLDRVVTHIWELRHHKIEEYRGNYSAFRKLRAERDAQLQAAAARQTKEVARVQKFVDRFRYQANKASQVQSRIKQLEKIKMIEIQRDPKRVKFRFPVPAASGRQVLELSGVAKRYGEKVVYEHLDFSVERGQRIALVGENGAGKSTLLKMLAGVLPPDKGSRAVGHGVTLHYFAQHQAETLNPEHTILESLEEATKHAEMNFLRGIAGAFLFSGEDQKKPIKALSGGERNRVALARMLVEPANTLLLDEPTNHLDPSSVDVLTDAMTEFPGTIIFISHDPTFLARIATRVVEIEDGRARNFMGDYEYYLWKKAQELDSIKETSEELEGNGKHKSPAPTRAMAQQTPTKGAGGERRDLAKTQQRLEKQVARAEADIAESEKKVKAREAELADPKLYEDFGRWNELHQEQEAWKRELERLTSRWESLSAELEEVKQKLTALR
ncbi:ABC-F family ATP-binding cassette domain-containing protein [Nitrospira moscoviensis]|uniref:Putative ABC-type transport system, ATPase component n=1 Tax=Nitrospira moscoviensis TaxID=42253 RepID=A0A0K2GHL6_NITMO|nr:ABC-F family ATP-binding cassette domain-containing protein [Nitrospira moscoviensis]ALA60440.1 putative ABC-type transport system, ATPase component [Nitrospira moscoviensis]